MIDQSKLVTLAEMAAFLGITPVALRERLRRDRLRPQHLQELPEPLPGKPTRWSPVIIELYRCGEWRPGKAVR